MREIEISQFSNFDELEKYLNHFANDSFGAQFFPCGESEDKNLFIEQLYKNTIRVFEYDYLLPFTDRRKDADGDMALSLERDIILNQYKGKGTNIESVRRTVLMFVNPYRSEIAVQPGNILVDTQSKSAIFTGSFTLEKLFNFILSKIFDEIAEIYVFPYYSGMPNVDSPFHQDIYIRLSISKRVKTTLSEHRNAQSKNAVQKTCF